MINAFSNASYYTSHCGDDTKPQVFLLVYVFCVED